jgi:hypothetical protein
MGLKIKQGINRCAPLQMDQTADASHVQTDYPRALDILSADGPFLRPTHHISLIRFTAIQQDCEIIILKTTFVR